MVKQQNIIRPSIKKGGKYVFVTGGVCSSLGKGLASASVGCLLEMRGYKIQIVKIDPYINIDAGTMSPYQHGEVYVTDDGSETDLDLGNYARFTAMPVSKVNSVTTGQVYKEVIENERQGKYLGTTVQVIPHITDAIKGRILRVGEHPNTDIVIIEVGGTVGDIESYPFLEAIRQIIHERQADICSVHLSLLPSISGGELKTKPSQHSIKELRSVGIHPDFILCRADNPVQESYRTKIERYSNVKEGGVISAHNVDTIYSIPFTYEEQKLDQLILKRIGLPVCSQISEIRNKWKNVVNIITHSEKRVHIAMVGKYIELHDSYRSVDEALVHGGIKHKVKVVVHKIDADSFERRDKNTIETLKECSGILVPGGFGSRGTSGMIRAAKYARENNIPYFGICLGLHIMMIEYARNVLGLKNADSTEFTHDTEHPVVALLVQQENITNFGGTMRLGANDSLIKEGTILHQIYGKKRISERHRHRYELSSQYIDRFEEAGLIVTATTDDKTLVESVQWSAHKWGIGVQFHPEFKSMPVQPHPLFSSFIKACL